jgi:hypothetical protein
MQKSKTNQPEEFIIKGNWDNRRDALQQKFVQLSYEDFTYEPGRKNELLNRLEARLNKGRQDVINIITKRKSEKDLSNKPSYTKHSA